MQGIMLHFNERKYLLRHIISHGPAAGTEEIAPGAPATDETTAAGNTTTTTDVLTTPEELEAIPQATFPLVNSFTVTFEQPGTYQYFCALHPWMTGQLIVRGEGGENQAGT